MERTKEQCNIFIYIFYYFETITNNMNIIIIMISTTPKSLTSIYLGVNGKKKMYSVKFKKKQMTFDETVLSIRKDEKIIV